MKKYSISPLFIMVLCSFILIDGTVFALYGAAFALIHESAHLLTLKIMGGGVNTLSLRGMGMRLETTFLSYPKEIATALAGPFINAVLCAVFFCFTYFNFNKELLFCAVSNLAIFCVNILPIYPLDGGRALYCALALKTERAGIITKTVSVIFLLPLAVLSVIILIKSGFNLSLVIICIYLAVMLIGVKTL